MRPPPFRPASHHNPSIRISSSSSSFCRRSRARYSEIRAFLRNGSPPSVQLTVYPDKFGLVYFYHRPSRIIEPHIVLPPAIVLRAGPVQDQIFPSTPAGEIRPLLFGAVPVVLVFNISRIWA